MPSEVAGSAADAKVSRIPESWAPAYLPAPISPVHTATSCCKNLPSSSLCIAGGNIRAGRCEAAAKHPCKILWMSNVQNAQSLLAQHTTRRRYAQIKIKWDQLEHHNTARELSTTRQLYRVDIEIVRFLKNCRVWLASVASHYDVLKFYHLFSGGFLL